MSKMKLLRALEAEKLTKEKCKQYCGTPCITQYFYCWISQYYQNRYVCKKTPTFWDITENNTYISIITAAPHISVHVGLLMSHFLGKSLKANNAIFWDIAQIVVKIKGLIRSKIFFWQISLVAVHIFTNRFLC